MTRHRHALRPFLEALERRDTPAGTGTAPAVEPLFTLVETQALTATAVGAGTVTATFAGGRLTVTGDAAGNALRVTQGADGRLTISGDGTGTLVRLNGGPVGGEVTLPAPVTGGVAINLADGADVLTLDGVELPGPLAINGGNGAGDGPAGNTVRLLDVHVGGNLLITNRAGADTTFLGGVVAVQGGLAIRNGPGDSTVWGEYATDLRVGGVFSVASGAGLDHMSLWGIAAAAVGGLAFNSGTDADGSFYQLHPFGDLTVAGGVQITNGPGPDANDLGGHNVTVGGPIVIRNGAGGGSTVLYAEADMSVGSVTVTNGAGFDDNSIESWGTAQIRGGVRFANGPGIGHNTIFGKNLLSVAGNVTYANGSADGLHLNTIGSWDTRIAGSVTVRSGDGDNDTSIAGDARIWIGGPTRITSGQGYDEVALGGSRVAEGNFPAADLGPVRIDNGDGGSEAAVVGGRLTVRGSVDVAAWGGTDGVVVASVYDSGSVAGHVFVDVGPGDQQLVAVGGGDGRVLTIGGGLGVWTADTDGADTVSLAGVDARSWTEVWTGGGADLVRETESTFQGAFDLDTGAGDDEVYLEWTGAATSFAGPVWVATGDGNDGILVGGDPDAPGQVTFSGASHWDGGAGAWDALVVRYTGGVFLGPDPVLTGFEVAF